MQDKYIQFSHKSDLGTDDGSATRGRVRRVMGSLVRKWATSKEKPKAPEDSVAEIVVGVADKMVPANLVILASESRIDQDSLLPQVEGDITVIKKPQGDGDTSYYDVFMQDSSEGGASCYRVTQPEQGTESTNPAPKVWRLFDPYVGIREGREQGAVVTVKLPEQTELLLVRKEHDLDIDEILDQPLSDESARRRNSYQAVIDAAIGLSTELAAQNKNVTSLDRYRRRKDEGGSQHKA